MRALIADDDRIAARIMSHALEKSQFDVSLAHDGESAWTLIQEKAPQLAIVDWMMPALDGPGLCRRIREDSKTAHMHLILLTSRDSREDVVAGLDSGADDYLIKPFDPEEMRARLQVGRSGVEPPGTPRRARRRPRSRGVDRETAAGPDPDLQLLQADPIRQRRLGAARELHLGALRGAVQPWHLPALPGRGLGRLRVRRSPSACDRAPPLRRRAPRCAARTAPGGGRTRAG